MNRLTKAQYWYLFLLVAFPINLWAILIGLYNLPNYINRTSLWAGIGYFSYSMLAALIETVLVFCTLVLLSLLLPNRWYGKTLLAQLTSLILTVAFWAILGQSIFLYQVDGNTAIGTLLVNLFPHHPLRASYILAAGLLLAIVLSPLAAIFLIANRANLQKAILSLSDRITTLSYFYLAIDIIASLLVVLRNLSPGTIG
ncbi:hypothetical protein ACFLYP_01975 [Chloroflexota bacterium]